MRDQKPRSTTSARPVKTIVASAVHWSCGQYVRAVTGARLKPMSMTTAPVTVGGSTAWMTRAPRTWMAMPQPTRQAPTTSIAPVRVPASPPWPAITADTPTKESEEPR